MLFQGLLGNERMETISLYPQKKCYDYLKKKIRGQYIQDHVVFTGFNAINILNTLTKDSRDSRELFQSLVQSNLVKKCQMTRGKIIIITTSTCSKDKNHDNKDSDNDNCSINELEQDFVWNEDSCFAISLLSQPIFGNSFSIYYSSYYLEVLINPYIGTSLLLILILIGWYSDWKNAFKWIIALIALIMSWFITVVLLRFSVYFISGLMFSNINGGPIWLLPDFFQREKSIFQRFSPLWSIDKDASKWEKEGGEQGQDQKKH